MKGSYSVPPGNGLMAWARPATSLPSLPNGGRKRALDLFVTALRYTGTLHRTMFANKNLTLVGCQEDPTAWSALAPMFRSSGIEFKDLNALGPGEFVLFPGAVSRRPRCRWPKA